jgi:hypothetical protein
MSPTAGLVAGVFATGTFRYFLSNNSYAGTLGSALGAIAFAILAIYLHQPSDKFAVYASYREHDEQKPTDLPLFPAISDQPEILRSSKNEVYVELVRRRCKGTSCTKQ